VHAIPSDPSFFMYFFLRFISIYVINERCVYDYGFTCVTLFPFFFFERTQFFYRTRFLSQSPSIYIYINKWILENSEEPNKFPRVTSIQ
jgi:hypothetical protein